MLSQRAKYALRAMVYLAERRAGAPVSVTEIANETKIPRAFLEQIVANLKRRNLLTSTRGAQGGFLLARAPEEISFADIIRKIEGPLALAPCATRTAPRTCPDCTDMKTCVIRPALVAAREATAIALEKMTLAHALMERGQSKSEYSD